MNFCWIYLLLVYGVAIYLARRAGALIRWRIAGLFYVLVLIFFFRPLTGPFVNFPIDVLRGMPPWLYVSSDGRMINPEQNDLPLQIVPWAHEVRESWKELRAPLWNSTAGAGYPLLANGQSSALSPLRILALPLPLGHAMAAEGAMKVLIGLTFMFLYCRRRGRSELASATAAVMFALSGFIVSWLHFPLATAACFLPAVLYALEGVIARPSPGSISTGAAIWAVVLFAGHPETAAHIFLFGLLYLIWALFVERRVTRPWNALLACGMVMIAAALLAAVFLLPFLEALPRARRLHDLAVQPFTREAMPYSDWRSAVLLIQPHFFGRVPHEKPWGPAETEALGGYTGMFGIAAFAAGIAAVVRRREWRSHEAFLAIATIVVFGILQGWPLLGEAIHYLLPLAAHARLRLVFVFLLAAQAAIAIDLVPRRLLLWGAIAAATVLAGLFAGVPFPDAERLASTSASVIPSVVVVAAAIIFAVTRRAPQLALTALLCSVAVELTSFGRAWNAPLPARLMYPPTPLLRALRDAVDADDRGREPFRVIGTGAVLFPNFSAIYGFEDVRAHDPMAHGRYLEFAEATAGYDFGKYFAMWENVTAPVIDYLNVKYVLTYAHQEIVGDDRFKSLYRGLDGGLYENLTVLPRFYAVKRIIEEPRKQSFQERLVSMGDDWSHTALTDRLNLSDERMRRSVLTADESRATTCTIVSARAAEYRLDVDTPRATMIVSSVPHWPGWHVERDGRPLTVQRVNGAFLGFVVPAGRSSIRVAYRPWTFRYGASISIATALILSIVLLRSRKHRVSATRHAAAQPAASA